MRRISVSLVILGLACTALAGAAFPLVMLNDLGPLLFPIGFALSVTGLLLSPRSAGAPATWPVGVGALGLLLLAAAAFSSAALAYAIDVHRIRPGIVERSASLRDWLIASSITLAGALCFGAGVRQRFRLSVTSSALWVLCGITVSASAFGLFLVLDRFFPLVD